MSRDSREQSRSPHDAISTTVDLGGPVHAWVHAGPATTGEREGEPAILCLHGLGGSALNFGPVAALLSARHPVVALDLLGHGGTRSGNPELSPRSAVTEQLQTVASFVAKRHSGPVVLVGHSLGGVLAVLHTLAHPETVQRLVLVAPPVPHRTGAARDHGLAARRLLLGTPLVRHAVERQLRRMSPAQLVTRQVAEATPHHARVSADAVAASVAEEETRRAAPDAAAARRTQWNAILGTLDLLARPAAWADRLAALPVPVLWLQGHDDLKVPFDDAARLVESVRSLSASPQTWQFRTRPDVGHLPHLEDPVWTADTVLAWLAEGDG